MLLQLVGVHLGSGWGRGASRGVEAERQGLSDWLMDYLPEEWRRYLGLRLTQGVVQGMLGVLGGLF